MINCSTGNKTVFPPSQIISHSGLFKISQIISHSHFPRQPFLFPMHLRSISPRFQNIPPFPLFLILMPGPKMTYKKGRREYNIMWLICNGCVRRQNTTLNFNNWKINGVVCWSIFVEKPTTYVNRQKQQRLQIDLHVYLLGFSVKWFFCFKVFFCRKIRVFSCLRIQLEWAITFFRDRYTLYRRNKYFDLG